MKLFLDSASATEINTALELWDIDGITTNPGQIHALGKPLLTTIREIANLVKGTDKTVSVHTNPSDHDNYQAIIEEAETLAGISPNFVISIPCTPHGFKACELLTEEGIRSNMTLCFTAIQALQAMRMDAYIVSPFIGWKEATGDETTNFISDIMTIKRNYGFDTEVLVAAVRNGRQITETAIAGADVVTASFQVYQDAFMHPYTEMGLTQFKNSWDETLRNTEEDSSSGADSVP